MTPNALYRALVEALESRLPPRVVSMALREGMAPTGTDPETLSQEDAKSVLRGAVYRQLQARGVARDEARAWVMEVEGYLAEVVAPTLDAAETRSHGDAYAVDEARSSGAAALTPSGQRSETGPRAASVGANGAAAAAAPTVADEATEAALHGLRQALRPFNLYFSWAEVRKLRSLVQLAEDEVRGSGDAGALIAEADAQRQVVHQKLEDLLVLQARTLADLEAALEAVEPLGTPAVRRLDALIATVREAQGRRTLVEAEAEQAERLARELRKLVESTVLEEGQALPDLGRGDGRPRAPTLIRGPRHDRPTEVAGVGDSPDPRDGPDSPASDTEDRLRALDLEGEAHDLDALATRHAELLRHVPALATELAALRDEHAAGRILGERLPRVAATWRAQASARQQALRHEFEAIRAELDALSGEPDTTELRHALTVALDVLTDGLPAVEDVANVRELHAAAVTRAERHRLEREEREARLADQRATVDAIRRRLAASRDEMSDEPHLVAAREHLTAALAALDDTSEPTGAAWEAALDAEAAWQRALAGATDDQLARRRARAHEVAARLVQLPDLPSLRARTVAIRREAEEMASADSLGDTQLAALGELAEQLAEDARAAVAAHIESLAREAGDPAPESLLRALQEAARQLAAGSFPDLTELEREVRATRDERRTSLRRRYLRARQEAHRLTDAGVPPADGLAQRVAEARRALDEEEAPEEAIAGLEAQLTAVEDAMRDRLGTFETRIADALRAFRTVARLNNDDVASVRRVLRHLDGQREALGRVSPGLQAQLFAALADAEATLERLQSAYEATRAVADQLVAGNRLDDVLGSLDALFGHDDEAPAAGAMVGGGATVSGEATEDGGTTAGGLEGLHAWLDDVLRQDDVDGAAVLSPGGRMIVGRVPTGTDAVALSLAIDETLGAWTALGERLGDEAPELARVDIAGRPTWVAPLDDQGCAVVWSRTATTAGRLGDRLRDDRRAVVEMLRVAAADG